MRSISRDLVPASIVLQSPSGTVARIGLAVYWCSADEMQSASRDLGPASIVLQSPSGTVARIGLAVYWCSADEMRSVSRDLVPASIVLQSPSGTVARIGLAVYWPTKACLDRAPFERRPSGSIPDQSRRKASAPESVLRCLPPLTTSRGGLSGVGALHGGVANGATPYSTTVVQP